VQNSIYNAYSFHHSMQRCDGDRKKRASESAVISSDPVLRRIAEYVIDIAGRRAFHDVKCSRAGGGRINLRVHAHENDCCTHLEA
jgi:hypothetical protein